MEWFCQELTHQVNIRGKVSINNTHWVCTLQSRTSSLFLEICEEITWPFECNRVLVNPNVGGVGCDEGMELSLTTVTIITVQSDPPKFVYLVKEPIDVKNINRKFLLIQLFLKVNQKVKQLVLWITKNNHRTAMVAVQKFSNQIQSLRNKLCFVQTYLQLLIPWECNRWCSNWQSTMSTKANHMNSEMLL